MHFIIIGSGVIGVAIAESLATRGASVSVLEMRAPGRGASHASAGILAPYIEARDESPLWTLGARSLALFDDWIARVRAASGRPIDYARTGSLEVAQDEDDARRLQASAAWLCDKGIRAEWLDRAALRSAEPATSPHALGAVAIADHGWLGVDTLVRALVQSARLAGAVFESPVQAVAVEPRRAGADVRAGDRRYSADVVIVASGSWSKRIQIGGVAALPVRPVRGQLLHLRWPDRATPPSRVVWGPGCYAVPWPDNSVLVGATVEDVGFDERSTVTGIASLMRAAVELLPDAGAAALDAVRVGLRPALPDDLPAIGALARAPRVVVATGHYRNGVLLAPLTAEIVTKLVLDGVTDAAIEVTSPDRAYKKT